MHVDYTPQTSAGVAQLLGVCVCVCGFVVGVPSPFASLALLAYSRGRFFELRADLGLPHDRGRDLVSFALLLGPKSIVRAAHIGQRELFTGAFLAVEK